MDRTTLETLKAELRALVEEAEARWRRRVLVSPKDYQAQDERRLVLERLIAAAEGEEYAEPVDGAPAPGDIGYEWHLVTDTFREATILSGDVGSERSLIVNFPHVLELRFGGLNDEVFEAHPLYGKGLDLEGLFVVNNSRWKRELQAGMSTHPSYKESYWSTVVHYLLRGKDGELSCLASGFHHKIVDRSIVSIRADVAFWRNW